MLGGVLPVNFIGGPDTIVEQIKQCRDQVGAGVIDLMFQTPASSDPVDALMHRLELFGEKILSRIRDEWAYFLNPALADRSAETSIGVVAGRQPSLAGRIVEAGTSSRCERLT